MVFFIRHCTGIGTGSETSSHCNGIRVRPGGKGLYTGTKNVPNNIL